MNRLLAIGNPAFITKVKMADYATNAKFCVVVIPLRPVSSIDEYKALLLYSKKKYFE